MKLIRKAQLGLQLLSANNAANPISQVTKEKSEDEKYIGILKKLGHKAKIHNGVLSSMSGAPIVVSIDGKTGNPKFMVKLSNGKYKYFTNNGKFNDDGTYDLESAVHKTTKQALQSFHNNVGSPIHIAAEALQDSPDDLINPRSPLEKGEEAIVGFAQPYIRTVKKVATPIFEAMTDAALNDPEAYRAQAMSGNTPLKDQLTEEQKQKVIHNVGDMGGTFVGEAIPYMIPGYNYAYMAARGDQDRRDGNYLGMALNWTPLAFKGLGTATDAALSTDAGKSAALSAMLDYNIATQPLPQITPSIDRAAKIAQNVERAATKQPSTFIQSLPQEGSFFLKGKEAAEAMREFIGNNPNSVEASRMIPRMFDATPEELSYARKLYDLTERDLSDVELAQYISAKKHSIQFGTDIQVTHLPDNFLEGKTPLETQGKEIIPYDGGDGYIYKVANYQPTDISGVQFNAASQLGKNALGDLTSPTEFVGYMEQNGRKVPVYRQRKMQDVATSDQMPQYRSQLPGIADQVVIPISDTQTLVANDFKPGNIGTIGDNAYFFDPGDVSLYSDGLMIGTKGKSYFPYNPANPTNWNSPNVFRNASGDSNTFLSYAEDVTDAELEELAAQARELGVTPLSREELLQRSANNERAIDIYNFRLNNGGRWKVENGPTKRYNASDIRVAQTKQDIENQIAILEAKELAIPENLPSDKIEKLKAIRRMYQNKNINAKDAKQDLQNLLGDYAPEDLSRDCWDFILQEDSPKLKNWKAQLGYINSSGYVPGQYETTNGLVHNTGNFVWAPTGRQLMQNNPLAFITNPNIAKNIRYWQTTYPHEFEHAFQNGDSVYQLFNPKHAISSNNLLGHNYDSAQLEAMVKEMSEKIGFAPKDPYLINPTELLARGTQIKNWLGITDANEAITPEQLKQAAVYYVRSGPDNNMQDFFKAITDYEKAAKFLSYATMFGGAVALPTYVQRQNTVLRKSGGRLIPKNLNGSSIFDSASDVYKGVKEFITDSRNVAKLETLGSVAKLGVQLIDPTGISGWGDFYNSAKTFKNNQTWANFGDLALNTLGIIPTFGGKAKAAGIALAGVGTLGRVANKTTDVAKLADRIHSVEKGENLIENFRTFEQTFDGSQVVTKEDVAARLGKSVEELTKKETKGVSRRKLSSPDQIEGTRKKQASTEKISGMAEEDEVEYNKKVKEFFQEYKEEFKLKIETAEKNLERKAKMDPEWKEIKEIYDQVRTQYMPSCLADSIQGILLKSDLTAEDAAKLNTIFSTYLVKTDKGIKVNSQIVDILPSQELMQLARSMNPYSRAKGNLESTYFLPKLRSLIDTQQKKLSLYRDTIQGTDYLTTVDGKPLYWIDPVTKIRHDGVLFRRTSKVRKNQYGQPFANFRVFSADGIELTEQPIAKARYFLNSIGVPQSNVGRTYRAEAHHSKFPVNDYFANLIQRYRGLNPNAKYNFGLEDYDEMLKMAAEDIKFKKPVLELLGSKMHKEMHSGYDKANAIAVMSATRHVKNGGKLIYFK